MTAGWDVVGLIWLAGMAAVAIELIWPRARGPAGADTAAARGDAPSGGAHAAALVLGLAALVGGIALAGAHWPAGNAPLGSHSQPDAFAAFVQVFVLGGALCALLIAQQARHDPRPGEVGLVLLSTAGAGLLAQAADTVGMLAGFAAALLPVWGLAAIRGNHHGREGALKGMVAGSLGMGLFGLGAALLAARVGTTDLEATARALAGIGWIGRDPLLVVGLACLIGGVGCLVAAVPFPMWFVDVVQSLSIPGALLLSAGVMASGLAAVCRLLLGGFHPVVASGQGYLSWTAVLHGLGLAALLVCNAMALVQKRFKRMTAYLAAGQAGLVLVTLAAVGSIRATNPAAAQNALGGILVFLAVLVVNWVGLFVAAAAIEDGEGRDPAVGQLAGFARSHPWLAVAVGLSLLCMAGMPLTAGFFARLYLLEAMVVAGWTGAAVMTALSLGLVLVMSVGLVGAMVLRPGGSRPEVQATPATGVVALLAAVTILLLGVFPGGVLEIAVRSAGVVLGGG